MRTRSRQIGWSVEENLLYQISRQLDELSCAICNIGPAPEPTTTTTTTAAPEPLKMTFDNIENAALFVADPNNIDDWNTFFDLPLYGTPFTSVVIDGNSVLLYGATTISIKDNLFNIGASDSLLKFEDFASCVTLVGEYAFGDDTCYNMTDAYFPRVNRVLSYAFQYAGIVNGYFPMLTQAGDSAFAGCNDYAYLDFPALDVIGQYCFESTGVIGVSANFPYVRYVQSYAFDNSRLTTFDFPSLIEVWAYGFDRAWRMTSLSMPVCLNIGGSVGDNSVFTNISGNSITLTVDASRMTCDGGSPDGDIQYLQANNTVTVITV